MPAAEPSRLRTALSQWPLLLALVLLWCALWQSFAPWMVLSGLAYALVVVLLFPMPRIPFSGRLNVWHAAVFTVHFLVDVVRSTVSVSAVILGRGRRARSSVVEVRLRSHDDLVTTLVSHALALVPGSLVLDVDRANAAVYLHCLDVTTDEEIEEVREKALRVEARIIRAVGTRQDLELLRRHPDAAPPAHEVAEHRRHPVYAHGADAADRGDSAGRADGADRADAAAAAQDRDETRRDRA